MSRSKKQRRRNRGVAHPGNTPANLPPGINGPGTTQLVAFQRSAFSGPLPPPDLLQKYNEIVPGLADRIVQMAERQESHRHDLEGRAVQADIRRGYFGMSSGLVVALVGLAIGGYLLSLGQKVEGSLFAGSTLAAIVGVFVYGTGQRRKEREEKTRILSGQK